jgi:hypothetical protein
MKLTTETVDKAGGITMVFYSVDGVLIATAKKFSDWFCTIKNGAPSNIRDRVLKCREFTWNKEGLIKIIGHSNFTVGSRITRSFNHITPDFMNEHPDYTWGFTGTIPSKKSILELINNQLNKNPKQS